MLTSESMGVYTESLKTVNTAFTPRQSVFFLPMAWMRAENNQYQPEHLLTAFSESTPLSYLTALLKKVNKMTESTLQSLYRYYSEMKKTWYKGNYSFDQEDVYTNTFFAIEDAIIKLPPQCKEDRNIKIQILKDLVAYTVTDSKGNLNFENSCGREAEALNVIDQIAAE